MWTQAFSLAVTGIVFQSAGAVAKGCGASAKNFIYVVPDGYGTASQTLARDYWSLTNGFGTVDAPSSVQIGADPLVIGQVRTQSSDSLITDSAAAATAFGCGIKTYNGAIAVDDDGMPVGSILEAAHLDGFKTGLVVTSRITHATPAAYSSHVLNRDSENEIAAQQIGKTHPLGPIADILMGGGRRQFLPESEDGKREDGVNLIEWAEEQGWTYASDTAGFTGAMEDGKLPLPFLGLFKSSHMSYELDRVPEKEPSLLEMAKAAIDTLESETADADKGFFIMIEASRIDHAGHANDVAGHVHDTVMYNEVMDHIKSFIDEHPDTQLLSAADHECGGLTLEDNYAPPVITKAKHTTEYLTEQIDEFEGDDLRAYLVDTILPTYGVTNATTEEVDEILNLKEDLTAMGIAMGHVLARQAGVNWATDYHTAADVVLFGYAEGTHRYDAMKSVMGTNQDNTNLPTYIEKVLGLDMNDATEAIRKNGVDWVQRRHLLEEIKRDANLAAANHAHDHSH